MSKAVRDGTAEESTETLLVRVPKSMLVPPSSALLDAPDTQKWLRKLDPSAYTYSWTHPDPRMDVLQQKVAALVEKAQRVQANPIEIFFHIKAMALATNGQDMCGSCGVKGYGVGMVLPHLTESWFC